MPHTSSAYVDLDRAQWSRLSHSTPLPLTTADIERLRGLDDPIGLPEVDAIYRPLSRLLNLYVAETRELNDATTSFLGEQTGNTPFVIGIAGSVAVGKSTVARLLRELMARWPQTPRVELVTTDGFLYPNATLERRGIMNRKGFPESYDRRALIRFVEAVKSGAEEISFPVYDHLTYDVLPGKATIHRPDVLIIEGLNVLQPAPRARTGGGALAVSDFFDFSIYVDAHPDNIRRWYLDRFLSLRKTAFSRPDSYFRRYADLDDAEALERAAAIWDSINKPNLERNIAPTIGRATLVMHKGPNHGITRIRLRRL